VTFTTQEFKAALGHYATGVVVVTAMTSEGPAGFTCQSFSSLSLLPPLVMFAAGVNGASWSKMRSVASIGISVLAHDQEFLARQFATSGIDKFEGVEWYPAPNGAPLVSAALAHVSGHVTTITQHGDHDVVVVSVDDVAVQDGRPSVYFCGEFQQLVERTPRAEK